VRIGVLGGGQLGRMLALAGYRLGLDFRFLDPSAEACAGQVGELLSGNFADPSLVDRFAAGLDVVTFEWENVPVDLALALAERLPVQPSPAALATAQNRFAEKAFFRGLAIATAPFAPVESEADLGRALDQVGTPALLKTVREGYDGKGQRRIETAADAAAAWRALGERPAVLEGYVPFRRELSIVAVRAADRSTAFYPLVENLHRDGILRRTLAPAPDLSDALQAEAESIAARALEALDYVGVLAIELFEHAGHLLANEMASRVHNSGHWTIEGAATSQFENHVRAVAGLPLGETRSIAPAAMVNLIGELPDQRRLLAIPGANLHLYGKAVRPGRKLGHVTVLGRDEAELRERLARVESVLTSDLATTARVKEA
jgi:5-(carboxyamino)imidazole ribonucleotide synthase